MPDEGTNIPDDFKNFLEIFNNDDTDDDIGEFVSSKYEENVNLMGEQPDENSAQLAQKFAALQAYKDLEVQKKLDSVIKEIEYKTSPYSRAVDDVMNKFPGMDRNNALIIVKQAASEGKFPFAEGGDKGASLDKVDNTKLTEVEKHASRVWRDAWKVTDKDFIEERERGLMAQKTNIGLMDAGTPLDLYTGEW